MPRFVLRCALGGGALAFVILGGLSVRRAVTAEHVREFQAGEPSGLAERLSAMVQGFALEGLGFALLFGLAAVVGGLLGGLLLRGGSRDGARFGGFVLALGALWQWCYLGTYFAGQYLPFLPPLSLAAVTGASLLAALAGLSVHTFLHSLAPGGGSRPAPARALGSAVALGFALPFALDFIQEHPAGSSSPGALLGGAGALLLSLPAAYLLALLFKPLVGPARIPASLSGATTAIWTSLCACALAMPFLWDLGAGQIPPAQRLTSATPKPAGPNVVYVVVDTLRADALSCYGYERPTSPFLDSIAEHGTLFEDAMSAAAWTKPSTATLLTGLYPSRHGALHHGSLLRVPEGEQTLAETFSRAGYATGAFVTNPNIKRIFAFDRGFAHFFDSPVEDTVTTAALRTSLFGRLLTAVTRRQFNWKYENDVLAMNAQILPWLEANRDERFFLYLHYIDPHSPYEPPARWRREFEGDHGLVLHNERKRLVGRDRYDAEIRYTDEGLEQLVSKLQDLDLWGETVFVLTSDHGEEWFEKDEVLGHGFSLYQPAIHVPLIAHGPGVPSGRRVKGPVELVDLPATLADLAGLLPSSPGHPPRHGDGTSFRAAFETENWEDPELAFLENDFGMRHDESRSFVLRGVRRGPWKLVLTEESLYRPPADGYPEQELYHMGLDPLEQDNLFFEEQHRPLVDELIQALFEHGSFLETFGLRDGEEAIFGAAIEAQLEQLGYLDD